MFKYVFGQSSIRTRVYYILVCRSPKS